MHELIRKDGVNDDRRRMATFVRELLSAVDAVDCLRDDLNDGEGCRPPELRTNLLKLHELAMNLDEQVSQMMNELEQVQDTLAKLVALYPESLSYADLDDADSDGGW